LGRPLVLFDFFPPFPNPGHGTPKGVHFFLFPQTLSLANESIPTFSFNPAWPRSQFPHVEFTFSLSPIPPEFFQDIQTPGYRQTIFFSAFPRLELLWQRSALGYSLQREQRLNME